MPNNKNQYSRHALDETIRKLHNTIMRQQAALESSQAQLETLEVARDQLDLDLKAKAK